MRVAILVLTITSLAALAPPASAAYRDACGLEEARVRMEAAHLDLQRAEARLKEAELVYQATRRYAEAYGSSVGRWVWLARREGFTWGQLPTAMYVIDRESNGDPRATNSSSQAAGLWQFLPAWWLGKWDPYDPRTSMRHAHNAVVEGGWTPWGL